MTGEQDKGKVKVRVIGRFGEQGRALRGTNLDIASQIAARLASLFGDFFVDEYGYSGRSISILHERSRYVACPSSIQYSFTTPYSVRSPLLFCVVPA